MPGERLDSLVAVLDAIRVRDGITQPRLTEVVGLGRSVVAQRVTELEEAGLVVAAGLAPSTGGRAPRRLRLRRDAGLVVGIDVGATGMVIGVADLGVTVLARAEEPIDIADGPEAVLGRVEEVVDELLDRAGDELPVWGIGVGLPGPVEFATGRPVAPPIMPGWDGYPVRERLSDKYSAPVWVDNDVNVRALGELRSNPANAVQDLLYVKIGTGIGAGIVSGGRLHRGADGCAGDIGHVAVGDAENVVCRCGNTGCLEAVAGGAAIAREGRRLAETGGSRLLGGVLTTTGRVTANDVSVAAKHGDPAARTLLQRAGRVVGSTLATLVSFYNPGVVVLGGGVVLAGDHVLAAIRESVYQRSLPLATRRLRIEPSSLGDAAGLAGTMHLVLDELFAARPLSSWLPHGSPVGRPELVLPDAAVPA